MVRVPASTGRRPRDGTRSLRREGGAATRDALETPCRGEGGFGSGQGRGERREERGERRNERRERREEGLGSGSYTTSIWTSRTWDLKAHSLSIWHLLSSLVVFPSVVCPLSGNTTSIKANRTVALFQCMRHVLFLSTHILTHTCHLLIAMFFLLLLLCHTDLYCFCQHYPLQHLFTSYCNIHWNIVIGTYSPHWSFNN